MPYVLIGLSGSGRSVVCSVWPLLYLVYSYYDSTKKRACQHYF
nr:MAG TPA: AAA domain protein [Caudoviricetes sp.]